MLGCDRRRFLNLLGGFMVGKMANCIDNNSKEKLPVRVLGRTGAKVPVIGLGFGPIGSGLSENQAIELMEQALDMGMTYWDTAPTYGQAQARIGKFLPKVREKVFLVSKVATDDAKRALEIVEQSLREMKTEWIDLVHIHNIGDFNPDRVLTKGGSLEGLREAQKRGWVRFVGITGHYRPSVMAKVLDSGEFDVVMCVLNFADKFNYDFEGKVLPVAQKHNAGVVAMKVMAAPQKGYGSPNPGKLADYAELSILYSLNLPNVSCAVIGVFTVNELKNNVKVVKNLRPLAEEELRKLAEVGKKLAQSWGAQYGDPS